MCISPDTFIDKTSLTKIDNGQKEFELAYGKGGYTVCIHSGLMLVDTIS